MSAQEKPNIIFIDDDPRILRSLNSIFRASHNVYITEDPDEFREKVATIPMDVIVCDQKMPQVSGTQLLAEVRDTAPDAMRILLTGYAERDDVLDAINQGEIYRYITKPWDSDDLMRTIGDATNIARALRQARAIESDGAEPPQNAHCGVMVMFENEKIFDKFRYVFQRHYTPYWAKDLDSAMEILLEKKIGIIISDVHFCGQDVVAAMNVLKSFFPQIMSIVVTQTKDSEALIDLINYGQVYRCLVRPVSTKLLSDNLRGAALRHAVLRDNPEERARHQVESLEGEDNDEKARELMDNIRKRQDARAERGISELPQEDAEAQADVTELELDFTVMDDDTPIFELEPEDHITEAKTAEDTPSAAQAAPEKDAPAAFELETKAQAAATDTADKADPAFELEAKEQTAAADKTEPAVQPSSAQKPAAPPKNVVEFTLGGNKKAKPKTEEAETSITLDDSDLAILDDASVEIIDAGYTDHKHGR